MTPENTTHRLRLDQADQIRKGTLEMESGRPDVAAQRFWSLLKADPNCLPAVLKLAECQVAMGDHRAASIAYLKATQLKPGSAKIFQEFGLSLVRSGQVEVAIKALERSLELDPKDDSTAAFLADSYRIHQNLDKAEGVASRELAKRPDSTRLKGVLARIKAEMGKDGEAERLFEETIEGDPGATPAICEWLQERGRFDESAQRLQQSLRVKPMQGDAYFQLAKIRRFELGDETLAKAGRRIWDGEKLSQEQRMFLAYALGAGYEHEERFDEAMRFFDEANTLAYSIFNAARPLDRNEETRYTERMMARFGEAFAWPRSSGPRSVKPILIVGMIRSGTTLLDQTLSSHPQVSSAGELGFWGQWAGVLGSEIALPDPGSVEGAAQQYVSRLGMGGQTPWVTDKMPLNYRYLGLARLAFPDIKVVHIERDPLDTCLSIYTNHFGVSTRWVYNQSNIVFAYRDYQKIMRHWRRVLPVENLIELSYEELVEDKEAVLRRIFEFCEIPWDDACLRHDANDASIRTPSRWQARQPIYKSSTGRWKRFEPYLGDLLELKSASQAS